MTGAVIPFRMADFWQEVEDLAYLIDGEDLGYEIEALKGFLVTNVAARDEFTLGATSLDALARHAVVHLVASIVANRTPEPKISTMRLSPTADGSEGDDFPF